MTLPMATKYGENWVDPESAYYWNKIDQIEIQIQDMAENFSASQAGTDEENTEASIILGYARMLDEVCKLMSTRDDDNWADDETVYHPGHFTNESEQ